MLPDFPKTKLLLSESFHRRIKNARAKELGILSSVEATQLHEGSKHLLHRNDGSSEEIEMKHLEASAQVKHDVRELNPMGIEDVSEILDELGQKLAAEQMKLMFQRIDRAVHEVGNVGDPNKPFLEQFFEMIEKQHLDYDDLGRPVNNHIYVGSQKAADKVAETLKSIENEPDLKKRYENLLTKKRQEWLDREAARNLVE